MRIFNAACFLALVCFGPCEYAAQAPAAPANTAPAAVPQGQPAPADHAADAAAKPVTPSAILKPTLDSIQQTLGGLRLEKWKGSTRTEASTNISSIQRDFESTLPPLLIAADAAPGTMSKVLPVSHNVDALYDVLLRVVDGARVSAPGDQFTQLQQSLSDLEKARRTLDARLVELATAQEKQVSDLQTNLKAQMAMAHPAPPPAPAPTPCPAPKKAPVKKKKPATTTQPSGTQPSGSQPATQPKPQN